MRVWLAVALTLICTAVFGHGSEQWINDAKLVDPVSRVFCCGPIMAAAAIPRFAWGNACARCGVDMIAPEWSGPGRPLKRMVLPYHAVGGIASRQILAANLRFWVKSGH
jgi:hypothetical protein